jgi:LmbE family N-acetylglucosaminyl deacetylase
MNQLIYLSPHLDDTVLSCGAIIWDQVRRHQPVEIWTLFAGDPPSGEYSPFVQELHQRWQTGAQAAKIRRSEDFLACERLNISARHFQYPDCIYRTVPGTSQPLIVKNEDLFQPLPAFEKPLIDEIASHLHTILPKNTSLVIPMGMGNHIDHQITRRVGESLQTDLLYYPDYPYSSSHPEEIELRAPRNGLQNHFPLSNLSLAAWQYAAEAYTSQISTFWPSLSDMYQNIENYSKSPIGNCLWKVEKY